MNRDCRITARRPCGCIPLLLVMQLALIPAARAQLTADSVLKMSPEELVNLQVTSVSKKPEPLADAPSSVYVITAEDIRRSTATTLTEVLRLAPNLQVASDNGIPGYVSARGHNLAVYTGPNKMLVLVDGRSVYSGFFSGVLWDAQEMMLEDIERIEVISGPAGVLWGVNAVNGVINIITRPAHATQGALVSLNAGERARDSSFRYGGQLGESASYRVYGRVLDRGSSVREADGKHTMDDWRSHTVGARGDWNRGPEKFSAQVNALSGSSGQPEPGAININAPGPFPRVRFQGLNGTVRWTRPTDDGGSLAIQAYYDHSARTMQPAADDATDTLDFEFQRNLPAVGRHSLTLGGNYRHAWDRTNNSASYGMFPDSVRQHWLSLFVQDEVALRPNLKMTAGLRIERGAYGTVDALPSARLAWRLLPEHLLWSAVSRGARGPSRLDTDFVLRVPGGPVIFQGDPNMRSEIVDVVEVGYRTQGRRGSFAASVYRNFYDKLTAVTTQTGGIPFSTANTADGNSLGIEMWGEWKVTPKWRLAGGLTALTETYRGRPSSPTDGVVAIAGATAGQTAQLRSYWNVGPGKEIDVSVRRVSSLGLFPVDSYNAIDARFGWKLAKNLELSIYGQNLFGTAHAEFGDPALRATMATRVFTKLTWRQ
ncbi:TonB-dependent receptor plug domain-containing protein [Lacisediminimonas profundi]|uniref:TonB-dependent receptor plug domain-containing protein n=1 Tax=Lacisediminimonas profundi TaxID=2603856 RepID=UPI00124AEECB|nr:TonB-dependent receptor [Lacisediminimonas profundi]